MGCNKLLAQTACEDVFNKEQSFSSCCSSDHLISVYTQLRSTQTHHKLTIEAYLKAVSIQPNTEMSAPKILDRHPAVFHTIDEQADLLFGFLKVKSCWFNLI